MMNWCAAQSTQGYIAVIGRGCPWTVAIVIGVIECGGSGPAILAIDLSMQLTRLPTIFSINIYSWT